MAIAVWAAENPGAKSMLDVGVDEIDNRVPAQTSFTLTAVQDKI
jgi:hypothetical protein